MKSRFFVACLLALTTCSTLHAAAAGIGAEVVATAELESFDGRFYSLRVTAHDGTQEIGRGTVGRAVINLSQFMTKMKQKRGLD